jgi:hypothetical protein
MSIRTLLAFTPTGEKLTPLTDDEIAIHLRDRYLANPKEIQRRQNALVRRKLYFDQGRDLMEAFIDRVFEDEENRRLRKAVIDEAGYNNVTRRITDALSKVYQFAATRQVKDRDSDARYKQLQLTLKLNAVMRRANRFLNLFRDIVLYFRVREKGDEAEPVLEIVTPDRFYAITKPDDPTQLVGLMLDQRPSTFEGLSLHQGRITVAGRPGPEPGSVQTLHPADLKLGASHFLVITDSERFKVDEHGRVIPGSWHTYESLDRMPAVLAHAEPPEDRLLDGSTGADLVAAHLAAWLQGVMLVKASKALAKQVALSGDLSTATRGQAIDDETVAELPEGVSAQTLDRGTDPGNYMRVAREIIETVASNYDIPPDVLRHAGATSGWEIELRSLPLRGRRAEQEETLRDVERDLAGVMAAVLEADAPELAFDPEGWSIAFGEVQAPMSTKERLDVFETQRRLGLTSTIQFLMAQNADLDEAAATAQLVMNIAAEVERNKLMRPLQQISGSMGAETPDPPATPDTTARPTTGE